MKLKIEKMGINGEGIGYHESKPVFIEGAFPSEVVEVELKENMKSYFRGKLVKIETPSKFRVPSKLALYRGHSYALIDMAMEEQLRQKRELVCQALNKYARIPSLMVEDTIENPQPLGYRNQLKMPIDKINSKLVSGMYLPNSNHFIPVEYDPIHEAVLDEKRLEIMEVLNHYDFPPYNKKNRKGIRTLVLRHLDGGFQCTIVTGRDHLPNAMVNELYALKDMKCVAHSVNTNTGPDVFGKELRVLKGDIKLTVPVYNMQLQVSCRSFFQLNTVQAGRLYELVHDLLADDRYKLIVEAYSGVGGLGLSVRDLAKEVIGIESISSAVKNANENAKLNNADHVKFVLGDAGTEMQRLVKAKKRIDVVIVDPPRIGLSEEFLESLIISAPKKIVYVSCNPSTLGKDLDILKQFYEVKRVIPFDMFSQTAHVETVVLLQHRNFR